MNFGAFINKFFAFQQKLHHSAPGTWFNRIPEGFEGMRSAYNHRELLTCHRWFLFWGKTFVLENNTQPEMD
jgi:hypothetical protein